MTWNEGERKDEICDERKIPHKRWDKITDERDFMKAFWGEISFPLLFPLSCLLSLPLSGEIWDEIKNGLKWTFYL